MAAGIGTAIMGSSIIGGGLGMLAADKQADAAAKAGELSWAQFQQTRADMEPWRLTGTAAIEELSALYGFGELSGEAEQPAPAANALWDFDTTAREVDARDIRDFGRGGDTEMAHVTPGEIVVPRPVAQQPDVQNALRGGFQREGVDPARYVVKSGRNSLNPRTGRAEFKYGADTNEGGATGFGGGRGNPRDLDQEGDRTRRLNRWPGSPAPAPVEQVPAKTPEELQQEAFDAYYRSPDYLIAFDEGQKAIERSAAARGDLFSGNTLTAQTRYGQDYANTRYNQYANRLMSLAGAGQTSAHGTGQFGAQAAGQYGNALMYGGQAQAGQFANWNNAIQSGMNNYLFWDYMR